MTKDEWIWVGIRLGGIYLLISAVMALPQAAGALYTFANLPAQAAVGDVSGVAASMKKAALGQGATAIAQAVLFLLAALYMLSRGDLIHRIASREGYNKAKQEGAR